MYFLVVLRCFLGVRERFPCARECVLGFPVGHGIFSGGQGACRRYEGVSWVLGRFPGCRIVFLGSRVSFVATRNNFFGVTEGYMGARVHFIGEK